MDRLWKSSQGIVGIDITDNAIVYAELTPTKDGYGISRQGEHVLDSGIIENSVVVDAERLLEALRLLAKKERITTARASIGHEVSNTLRLRVPVVADSEIRTAIQKILAEQVVIDSIVFDFRVVARTPEYIEVVVFVSPKHVVDTHADVFSRAGIELVSLTPRSHALIHSVMNTQEGQAVLVVDIGERNTAATIIVGGYVASVSFIAISSKDLREDANHLLLQPVFSQLKEAIRSVFLEWHLKVGSVGNRESSIGKIILVGKGASVPGLAEYLATTLSVDVTLGNPWMNVQLPTGEVPPVHKVHVPQYAAAIGLSLMSDPFGMLLPEGRRVYFNRMRWVRIAIFALLWLSVFALVIFIFSVSI